MKLVKCLNYSVHNVCNRCVAVDDSPTLPPTAEPTAQCSHNAGQNKSATFPETARPSEGLLCDCCVFNDTIPDLSVAGNQERWYRLEKAKRRLFYTLELLQLPRGHPDDSFMPILSFAFLGDPVPEPCWRPAGTGQRIYTGYSQGRVTINIREADSVEREKARVELNEPQRTLIGHFRHEIGHYFWDVLVADQCEDAFAQVFDDHREKGYGEAKEAYYRDGPPPDWPQRYISAYAAMHPAEDFAETFGAYLDIVSLLDTACHVQLCELESSTRAFDKLLSAYRSLGVAMNELNRDMGLIDIVPEVFVPPIEEKLRFVHELCARSRDPQ